MDYHNLYLTTDVLLLADILSNFKIKCLHIYGLDPNYYLTVPSLSWNAMLKYSSERYGKDWNIELLTDINMYLDFIFSTVSMYILCYCILFC